MRIDDTLIFGMMSSPSATERRGRFIATLPIVRCSPINRSQFPPLVSKAVLEGGFVMSSRGRTTDLSDRRTCSRELSASCGWSRGYVRTLGISVSEFSSAAKLSVFIGNRMGAFGVNL